MYLHLGQNAVVHDRDILGIFDLDTSTVSKNTRDYLSVKEKEKKVVTVSYELPRSFVVCAEKDGNNEKVYISQLSTATLERRADEPDQF